ncbi:MAG: nucleotidyltransferase family protein [Candidatus Methylacidiphilales bacterium]
MKKRQDDVVKGKVTTAFILGAGLGTRLRPLTDQTPKPLLNIGGRPLIFHALDRLKQIGVNKVIINTHHCANVYIEVFPEAQYAGLSLMFRHEPELLETAGGLKNIEDLWDAGESLLIYNGDVLTNLPLEPLVEAHQSAEHEVTLALRSRENPRQVSLDPSGRVRDLRGELGADDRDKRYVYTGICMVNRRFLRRLTAGKKESLVPVWLDMIRSGEPPHGLVLDTGFWYDIGTLEMYERLKEGNGL